MTPEHVADIARRARAARLVAVYANDQIHFTAENPVDARAPAYFSADTYSEAVAFIHGWTAHEFDEQLRHLALMIRTGKS